MKEKIFTQSSIPPCHNIFLIMGNQRMSKKQFGFLLVLCQTSTNNATKNTLHVNWYGPVLKQNYKGPKADIWKICNMHRFNSLTGRPGLLQEGWSSLSKRARTTKREARPLTGRLCLSEGLITTVIWVLQNFPYSLKHVSYCINLAFTRKQRNLLHWWSLKILLAWENCFCVQALVSFLPPNGWLCWYCLGFTNANKSAETKSMNEGLDNEQDIAKHIKNNHESLVNDENYNDNELYKGFDEEGHRIRRTRLFFYFFYSLFPYK